MKKNMLILMTVITTLNARNIPVPATFGVDFHTSMESTSAYNRRLASNNKWSRTIELYTQHIVKNRVLADTPRIPTFIHQIWLGSVLPDSCKALQKTWFEHQGDWAYFYWTDTISEPLAADALVLAPHSFQEITVFIKNTDLKHRVVVIDVRGLDFSTRKHFEARANYGEKSDILRYEILYHCGGLYVDTDFECLQSFDVFNYACDFYAGIDTGKYGYFIHNSLIASRAKHPIVEGCMHAIRAQTPQQARYTGNDVMSRTGPILLTNEVWKHISTCNDRTVIFPITYFHPWPNLYKDANTRAQIERWIKPESYGIHHWHVSWLPQ